MNRANPFASSAFFKSPSQYLRPGSPDRSSKRSRSLSLDDSDNESGMLAVPDPDGRTSRATQRSRASSTARPIRLISLSRSPSPYLGASSVAQSETEDDYELADAAQDRSLLAKDVVSKNSWTAWSIVQRGGLGHFLFSTGVGWHIYVALLVFWAGGCQFGLLLMNRFILWTGTYKFPYPLTLTLLQLLMCHVLVVGFASLTRGLGGVFRYLGLGAAIAPSQGYSRGTRATRYRGGQKYKPVWQNVATWLTHGSGGVAGGGLFEFQWRTAKHVLPVAVVFMAKVVLSNLSFAYAVLPMYMLARIAVTPFSLLLTFLLLRTPHSVQTLSSALTAMLNLLMASIRPGSRVTWESIVSGVFSSLFVALYPVLLLRAYRQLVSDLVPQGDLLLALPDDDPANPSTSGTKEESRAYWRLLHYTSLLAIALLLPIVLVSGELQKIHRNCYFLDVPWFWFLMLCGGVGSWAVFSSFLLLIKATSPLTATFVAVPRSAWQLAVLSKFRLPAHSWVGVSLCWASCLWYLWTRRREGWGRERMRVEGR